MSGTCACGAETERQDERLWTIIEDGGLSSGGEADMESSEGHAEK